MRDPFTLTPAPRAGQYREKFIKEIKTEDDKLLMEAIISNYDLLMILREEKEEQDLCTVKLYQSKLCNDGFKVIIIWQQSKDISLALYEEYNEDTEQDVEKQEI